MERRISIGMLSLAAVITQCEVKSVPSSWKQGDEEPPSGLHVYDFEDSIKVSTPLYDDAQLPCSLPFVHGPGKLTMAWKKEANNSQMIIIHSFMDGRQHHLAQDSRYVGRTELSTDLSHGDLSLKLRGVTFADEGTYYCLAANDRNREGRKVELSISGLHVLSQGGTLSDVDGKKRLTCITIGMFRDPWVRWYDFKSTNLTEYETHHMTEQSHGMKKVESVLQYNDEVNNAYACQVGEGNLATTVHIGRTDGKQSVRVNGPIPGYSSPKKEDRR